MSESRTEKPTPKRLRDARRKGQVARSALLSGGAATAGGLWGTAVCGAGAWARLSTWTARLLAHPDGSARQAVEEGLGVLGRAALPSLAGAFLGALAASTAMAGFHFEPSLLLPKWERVSPQKGFGRLFNLERLADLAKALMVAALLAWMVWHGLDSQGPHAFRVVRVGGAAAMTWALGQLSTLATRGAVLLVALGLADLGWARWRHFKSLRMSRDERVREHKDQEGDPLHKGRRRAAHRQLASGGPARGVAKASCVVVNPTHIAVALRYDASETDSPYLVAKGRQDDALVLRREAQAMGVPVVKDIALARSLVSCDVGEEIPEELFHAVAAVLEVAYRERPGR